MIRPVDSQPERPSVTTFLDYLKNRVLGNTVVHEENIAANPARYADDISRFPVEMAQVIQAAGVDRLYSHQAEGIDRILTGRNVVVSTPTASGKTLIYNAPVLTSLLRDPAGHALYVFPLKALEWDQRDELEQTIDRLDAPRTLAYVAALQKDVARQDFAEHFFRLSALHWHSYGPDPHFLLSAPRFLDRPATTPR